MSSLRNAALWVGWSNRFDRCLRHTLSVSLSRNDCSTRPTITTHVMNGKRHVSSVRVALDEDWTAQAGTLEWSCLRTAAHGIGAAFDPPAPLAHRLREHTRPWPAWTATWDQLGQRRSASCRARVFQKVKISVVDD